MPNETVNNFIAQAQRNQLSQILGPEFMLKQSYFTVDTSTNIWNVTYGKKLWDGMNNQTRFWNGIKKVVWGNVAGWRVRTDRGSGRSRPVTETGTLPTVDVSAVNVVSSTPRTVATTFGVSNKSIFVANLEGGIGDILAAEAESSQRDHLKEINQEILAGGAYLCSAGAATTFTVPASIAHHYKIGDTVSQWDDSANNWIRTTGSAVSAVNESTGVVTVASSTTFDNTDIAAIYSRAGFTSIDDIVTEDGARYGGGSTNANFAGDGGTRSYDLTFGGRVAGAWNAGARVSTNNGVSRDISLLLIDNQILSIRDNGGEPKLMLTGNDQYFKFERLLQTQQRWIGREEYQVGVGDERTFPGTRVGMDLSTYMGVAILTDTDTPHSVASDDTVLGSNVYMLDTEYLELAVALPTQYIENRDYFAANALVVRGLVWTMGELRCTGINRQGKIVDLSS